MNDRNAAFCARPMRQHSQLRQQLPSWSGHIATWLDQTDIPVELVRYEDMQAEPAKTLSSVLAFAGRPAGDEQIGRAVNFADFAQLQAQESEKGFREAPRPDQGRPLFSPRQSGWLAQRVDGRTGRAH
ncbi:MAG: sulfotransferase domain-containing protein [Pseudolabrys sp.]